MNCTGEAISTNEANRFSIRWETWAGDSLVTGYNPPCSQPTKSCHDGETLPESCYETVNRWSSGEEWRVGLFCRKEVTEEQVVVVVWAMRRLRRAAAGVGASAAGSNWQGSMIRFNRSGIQMEATLGWKTVRKREMKPNSISSAPNSKPKLCLLSLTKVVC